MDTDALLSELTPTVESLLERHLESSKEWFPHEHVPFSRGRDHVEGEEWSEEEADLAGASLSDAVRSALYVNLLTEDNLPYYFRSVERMFGKDGPWGTWVRRWTAEEGRHSMVIYGYLATTRAIDLKMLERGRMAQVSRGETPEPESMQEGFIYLSLQELATRISHRNTGLQIGDPVGYEVMRKVCGDENLHQLFYRDLAAAAIEADPNTMMIAMEKQVRTFTMPGTGIPDFDHHASLIAQAGIYDLQIHHEQILAPVVLRQWDAENIGGLTGEGAEAQERLMKRMAKSERVAKRYAEKRAAQVAAEQSGELQPA
ncbi:MAG: acyl-ACP desaturase [Actinomycetota bacterium]